MARKPAETVQVNLRIKEGRRRKLQRLAEKNQISFNKQIEILIDDALENKAKRTLDDIASDIKANWLRYGDRHLLLSLEDSLADALAKTNDPKVSTLAQAWLKTKKMQQRHKDDGDQP